MLYHIPFIRPALPTASQLSSDIESMVESNWFSNFGPFEQRFRGELSSYLGNDVSVVTLNNATTGLLAGLASVLPRGDGSKCIAVASFTFAAAAHAIIWQGYSPAWMDIDVETLQPSLASAKLLLECSDISAIILTNTFGIANEQVSEWEDLARSAGIPLVIDSAAGFGSTYQNGEVLGARGDCEVFSFHATKPFAIGEGGALATRSSDLAESIRQFTNFGFGSSQGAIGAGLNGKLQEINAAIGLHQLQEFENNLARRRQVLGAYEESFATMPIRLPFGIERSSLCFATIILEQENEAKAILAHLNGSSIEARSYYAPSLHEQPWFNKTQPVVSLEGTISASSRIVSLPVLPNMSDLEVEYVTSAVHASLA